ncbi:MAG: hypothetical protein ACLQVD_07490 [Capsulimonadaceae bacterium]
MSWMRPVALGMSIAWALWVLLFTVGEASARNWIVPTIAFVVLIGSIVTAWLWEPVGGLLLLIEGLAVCLAYPMGFFRFHQLSQMLLVVSTFGLPPIVSGLLYLGRWYLSRTSASA